MFRVCVVLFLVSSSVCALELPTSELVQRLDFLENQGKQQATEIANQRQELINQKIRHRNEAVEQRTLVNDLQNLVKEQGQTIKSLEEKIDTFEGLEILSKDEHQWGNSSVNKRSATRRQLARPVAFQVVVTATDKISIAIGEKIMYDTVEVNLGNGYNEHTGVFTAPQAGMYIFSTSVMTSFKPHNEIVVGIVKNGNRLVHAFAHGDENRDQGSATTATQLAAGDEVWTELLGPANDSLWGNNFFMGCLVEQY